MAAHSSIRPFPGSAAFLPSFLYFSGESFRPRLKSSYSVVVVVVVIAADHASREWRDRRCRDAAISPSFVRSHWPNRRNRRRNRARTVAARNKSARIGRIEVTKQRRSFLNRAGISLIRFRTGTTNRLVVFPFSDAGYVARCWLGAVCARARATKMACIVRLNCVLRHWRCRKA